MTEYTKWISSLIFRHSPHGMPSEPLTNNEKRELDNWIAESRENAQLFEKLSNPSILKEVERDFDDASLVAAAERISQRVGFKIRAKTRIERRLKMSWFSWRWWTKRLQ